MYTPGWGSGYDESGGTNWNDDTLSSCALLNRASIASGGCGSVNAGRPLYKCVTGAQSMYRAQCTVIHVSTIYHLEYASLVPSNVSKRCSKAFHVVIAQRADSTHNWLSVQSGIQVAYMHVCIHIHVHVHVYMYIHTYVCMSVYIYNYIYKHVRTTPVNISPHHLRYQIGGVMSST